MKNPELDTIPTRVGHAGWHDHRHFGSWVFAELAGNISTTGLVALAATGRRLDEEDCRVLDDIATVLSVADPRIYPLKLVRLASAYGDPLAGLAAAVASMEGAIVGPQIAAGASLWLLDIASRLKDGIGDPDAIRRAMEALLRQTSRLAGFGVPFRKEDERRKALAERIEARGRCNGKYWKLARNIALIVEEMRGVPANVGLSVAAISLDMGLDPATLAPLYTGLTINVFLANAVEGANQAPDALRLLPEDSVEYVGKEPRRLADKPVAL